MAKIEIRGTVEKLDDIAVFLKRNHIEFCIVEDIEDRSSMDAKKYRQLTMKYNH
jgi:hypothetical protein